MIHYVKQGDRRPPIRATLLNPDGTVVDLTGATVRFSMASSPGVPVVNEAIASIIDSANGVVEYAWQTADTTNAGEYIGEFEVTWGTGEPQTFPNDGYISIIVKAEIA